MPKDFLTTYPTFSLDMHHRYRIGDDDWRFVYQNTEEVTFSAIEDPGKIVTFPVGTLNRMNADGSVKVVPFGLMPKELRQAPDNDLDQLSLAGLSPAHRRDVEVRHAMVQGFLSLREAGLIKGTDTAITAGMAQIRDAAADFLEQELPDPEYAEQVRLWKEGKGRKPKMKKDAVIPNAVSSRTLRNWLKAYKLEGKKGLIDSRHNQGNRNTKFAVEEISLMAKVVNEKYMTLERKTVPRVYEDMQIAFRNANERRADEGKAKLKCPSLKTLYGFIGAMDKFRKLVARHGQKSAMKKMRAVKTGLQVSRPLERVEMDEWKIDILTILIKSGLLLFFEEKDLEELGLKDHHNRWWLVAAICCRTRVILGMVLTANPKSSAAIKCLKMVMSDKGTFADAVGALSPWSMFGTPEVLAVDNGSAFKSVAFTTACADAGIMKVATIAGDPAMRGRIESVFNTIGHSLMPRLTGQTFRNTLMRGDHPAEKRACLSLEDLAFVLVRWVIDIYHNQPHDGLGGRTPLAQWEADMKDGNYPLHSAPSQRQKRLAFGLSLKRIVQKGGIRALNVNYHSGDLARWFLKHGSQAVEIRWFDENLGVIEVLLDGQWTEVPATSDLFRGVDASTWTAARRALRATDPKRKEWEEEAIFGAIRSIEALTAERKAAYSILDHGWTLERFNQIEDEAVVSFDVVPTRPVTAEVADNYGMSVVPEAPLKPTQARTAVETAPEVAPAKGEWTIGD